MARFRQTKNAIREILLSDDWQARLSEFEQWTPGVIVPPLLSLRLDKEEAVRWRTATAFGLTAARMAAASMEKTRTLMRTCMWYMNEESGNLGWSIPHFMGEAMALDAKIAKEFHKILSSYIFCDEDCDGNFLDHPALRRDVFWGLARLAEVRPEMVELGERFLVAALEETDPYNRAYAARALGLIRATGAKARLEELSDDERKIRTFQDRNIIDITVGEIVSDAVKALS